MEHAPTSDQVDALDAISYSHVLIDAPPGTGKSFVVVEACRRASLDGKTCLVVAYNTELAAELLQHLTDAGLDDVQCHTFHGLCTHCVGLARDDDALESWVDGLETTEIAVSHTVAADFLIIDEAQDITRLHVRLLSALFGSGRRSRLLVVGDPRQRLYDFGTNPSLSTQFDEPELVFASLADTELPWTMHRFTSSHRITPCMARTVSCVFGYDIVSAKPSPSVVSVHLHPTSAWSIADVVRDIVIGENIPLDRIFLLAASKHGNAPLRTAVNKLSEDGMPIFVQGVDAADPRVRRGKLRVSSFHAAKGGECDVCIVLAPSASRDMHVSTTSNALYVALTRARRSLHVVAMRGDVDIDLVDALRASGAHVHSPLTLHDCVSSTPPVLETRHVPVVELRTARSAAHIDAILRVDSISAPDVEASTPPVVETVSGSSDVSALYARGALAALEMRRTGRVRVVDDVLEPPRLTREDAKAAIRCGHHGRFVSPQVRDDVLLAPDLRVMLRKAYTRLTTGDSSATCALDACTCAAATLAWSNFQHVMRQTLGGSTSWVDSKKLDRIIDLVSAHVPPGAQFDVRLRRQVDDVLYHARATASHPERAVHVVWDDVTPTERAHAGVLASMHPSGCCALISVSTGMVDYVYVQDASRDDVILFAHS